MIMIEKVTPIEPKKIKQLASDVKVGRTCEIILESGEKQTTGVVTGWLKNIKGELCIRTTNKVFIGMPGCDKILRCATR